MPGIAVTRPLWMQRAHRHSTAPQRHADIDQQVADTLEEIVCGCASEPLANGPTVDLDDAPSEYAVKAHRQANVFARWGRIVHSRTILGRWLRPPYVAIRTGSFNIGHS